MDYPEAFEKILVLGSLPNNSWAACGTIWMRSYSRNGLAVKSLHALLVRSCSITLLAFIRSVPLGNLKANGNMKYDLTNFCQQAFQVVLLVQSATRHAVFQDLLKVRSSRTVSVALDTIAEALTLLLNIWQALRCPV